MRTTTIRVDTETHAALLELAAESGASLMVTTKSAAEALRRERFAHHVTQELHALRGDPESWADYLADAERTSVGDGVS